MIAVTLIFVGFAQGIKRDVVFAKENTDIKLHCPYPSTTVTWTNPVNDIIVIQGKIKQNLTNMHKYRISYDSEDKHTLVCKNFTSMDEGVYRCQMETNRLPRTHEIILYLCSTPVEAEPFKEHNKKLLRVSSGFSENYICKEIFPAEDDIIEKKTNLWTGTLSFRNNKERPSRVFETSSIYDCLQINEQLCSLNRSFYLNTTHMSDAKEQGVGQDIFPSKYSCRCNDSFGEYFMSVFHSEKVLYLPNWERQPQENVVCYLEKDMEINVQVQGIAHAFIAVSGVFVFVLSVLLCLHIQGTISKKTRNFEIENHNNNRGSRGSQSEAYSSIERRQQIILGQQISYSVVHCRNPNATPENHDIDLVEDEIGNAEATASSIIEKPKVPELQYIDVQINSCLSESKFIIGDDRRTPYADIDLTLKADPLPDSDSSSEENEDDCDFMTLGDMQALMRARESGLDEE